MIEGASRNSLNHFGPIRWRAMLAAIMVFAITCVAGAAPLTDQHVRAARRIILLPGTFDMLTNGHIDAARVSLQRSGADIVIFLPNILALHKKPLPYEERLRLIDLALHQDQRLLYPSEGEWHRVAVEPSVFGRAVINRLRTINRDAEILLTIGQDLAEKPMSLAVMQLRPDGVLVTRRDADREVDLSFLLKQLKVQVFLSESLGISSSRVRKFLHENFELYFADLSNPDPEIQEKARALGKLLPEPVLREILSRGLYLDRDWGGAISPFQFIKRWLKRKFMSVFFHLNLYDEFKRFIVSLKADSDTKEIQLNGRRYPIKAYLGSGLTADAFVISIDGADVVVKRARSVSGRKSILRSIPIQLWAQERFEIPGPRVIDYDPEGKWMVSEWVPGQSVIKYLESGGTLTEDLRQKLRELREKANALAKTSLIGVDFSPDNILIKNGQPYLVDFGPLPIDVFASEFVDARLKDNIDRIMDSWQKKFGRRPVGYRCEAVFRGPLASE